MSLAQRSILNEFGTGSSSRTAPDMNSLRTICWLSIFLAVAFNSDLKAALFTNEIVSPYDAPIRNWDNPVFSFPRFDVPGAILQRVELEYSVLVSAGDFTVNNNSSSGDFVTVIWTNFFTLQPPLRTRRLGTHLSACTYSPARSYIEVPPNPAVSFVKSFVLTISGQEMTNYQGVGEVKMPMQWSAGFFVYRRSITSCSELFEKLTLIHAGEKTFQLSAIVTLRYVYAPLEITSFRIEPTENKASLSWQGGNLTGISCVIESSQNLSDSDWLPLRTNTPTSPIGTINDLLISPSEPNFFRVRVR